MNVLLVDDNRFVIGALEQKIDWDALGVKQVFSSSNIIHAQDIFCKYSIDLLICDIEMPQGNGLELLSWIREREYNTQVIFLTSYADFNYAQKAIELQSFDYFLKPIAFDKLTIIIQKVLNKVKKDHEKNNELVEKELLWHESQKQLCEVFWYKIVTGKIHPIFSAITKAINDHHVCYTEKDIFLPILFNVFSAADCESHEDKSAIESAIVNILVEKCNMFNYPLETLLSCEPGDIWIAVIKVSDENNKLETINHLCEKLLHSLKQKLSWDVSCIIGNMCFIQTIHQTYTQLLDMNDRAVNNRNRVLKLSDYNDKNLDYCPPDIERIESLLKQLDSATLLMEVEQYLYQFEQRGLLTKHILQLFRMDMTQLIYSFLKVKGVHAHKLMHGAGNKVYYELSQNSMKDMIIYITYLVETTIKYCQSAKLPQTLVEKVKGYVLEHFAEDLPRNKLADLFFINQDYLSRLFTRETGMPLISYITQIRIEKAKELLKNTNEPVHYIASKVGYGNYSHFSKIFKEYCGYSPKEYRKTIEPIHEKT